MAVPATPAATPAVPTAEAATPLDIAPDTPAPPPEAHPAAPAAPPTGAEPYGATPDPTLEPTPEPAAQPRPTAALPPLTQAPPTPETAPTPELPTAPVRTAAPGFIGDRPPTYAAEPVALPVVEPAGLGELVPDTVLDGAQYGSLTLRAVSQRGDSARYRGAPRRDALLLARFGTGAHTLLLAAVASGPAGGDPRAAHDACAWIGGAVARSCARLAEDLRAGHRSALRSGLQRLADRGYGKLRARSAVTGGAPEPPAAVRCLLLPADPACRTRVFFGVGEGGFLRLRDGLWEDLEPAAPGREPSPRAASAPGQEPPLPEPSAGPEIPTPDSPLTSEAFVPGSASASDVFVPGSASAPARDQAARGGAPRSAPFLFTTVTGRRGDALLLCSAGLAEPLADEPALAARLATDFSAPEPPGLTSFLASAQIRVKGHARDRTAVGVWDT
ncbi:protein phosphatase 2C domain-containing protein [Streptomyces sp. BBFR2]|uniref:protein phosphatase 2C domain-containing protein n=1 Tax=Streptomyces sp. BBFR2 TaxID=3372854 RepID=UPI0037D9B298